MDTTKEEVRSYHDRVQSVILGALKEYPDSIRWESFKSDAELQQWIDDATRKEFYEAARILTNGLKNELHKK